MTREEMRASLLKRGRMRMARRKKRIWSILTALLAVVFLVSAGMVIRTQLQYRKIIADSNEAARIAGLPEGDIAPSEPVRQEPAPEETAPEETEEPLPGEAAALEDLDLAALQAINGDVVGWIVIPGTELSYPMVQGKNNSYYLYRNWKREKSDGGSVFLEATSSRDLTDFHTIVYGHRMRNDTMFGTLKYYKDEEFLREHPSVYLTVEGSVYRYDIFAVQEASVQGLVYRLDLETSHLEEEFIQFCIDNSVVDSGLVPGTEDRILTLSTCTGSGHATRWVVHAVLRDVWEI